MKKYKVGQTVWVWQASEPEPEIALVLSEDPEECLLLIGIRALKKHKSAIWLNKSEAKRPLVLPNARRVYPGMITSQIVQVQPMNLPSGLLFGLDNIDKDNE